MGDHSRIRLRPKLTDMEISAPIHYRFALIALITAASFTSVGCRICSDCEDIAYPAYGGAWERTQRNHGRVGSVFDPGGALASTLINKDIPLEPDEIERIRQSEEGSEDGQDEEDEMDSLDPFEGRSDRSSDEEIDSMDLESDMGDADIRDDDLDEELERRKKELQDMELQDIQVIPGDPLPPVL